MATSKSIILTLSLICFTNLSTSVRAGNAEGNGGWVVACPTDKGDISYSVLDYARTPVEWEFEHNPPKVEFNTSEKPEFTFAKALLERLRRFDQLRTRLYLNYLDDFESESKQVTGYDFFPIDDSTEIGIPEGCYKVLAINQRQSVLPNGKRYYINAPVWEKLDTETRAGLLVHEVIYRDALALGSETSDGSSYLNAWIMSDPIYSCGNMQDGISLCYKRQLEAAGLDRISSFPIRLAESFLEGSGMFSPEADKMAYYVPIEGGMKSLQSDDDYPWEGTLAGKFGISEKLKNQNDKMNPYLSFFASKGAHVSFRAPYHEYEDICLSGTYLRFHKEVPFQMDLNIARLPEDGSGYTVCIGSDGNLSEISWVLPEQIKLNMASVAQDTVSISNGKIFFLQYSHELTLEGKGEVTVQVTPKHLETPFRFKVDAERGISFYDCGTLKDAYLLDDLQWQMPDGSVKLISKGEYISFDELGQLESFGK